MKYDKLQSEDYNDFISKYKGLGKTSDVDRLEVLLKSRRSILNNSLQDGKKDKILEVFFVGIIPMVSSMIITTILNSWYYRLQMSIFSSNNALLFISPSLAGLIIFYSPFTIIFSMMYSIRNVSYLSYIRIMKIKVFSLIAIVTFIISAFILVFQFYEWTDINQEGICTRNGVFSTNKNYVWNDVEYVDVSYYREGGDKSARKLILIYDIHLNDGTIVNAYNSKNFFGNIVNLDNFMENKKIKINRSKIQASDYKDFQIRYEGNTLQVLLEILDK